MSLALSMKSLVEYIRSSKSDRYSFVSEVKKDTKILLARFDKEQEAIGAELKEMAADLRKFLAESESSRKEDFGIIMKSIKKDLGDIKTRQNEVRKEARASVKEYAADFAKAREYWLSLSHKPRAAVHKVGAEA